MSGDASIDNCNGRVEHALVVAMMMATTAMVMVAMVTIMNPSAVVVRTACGGDVGDDDGDAGGDGLVIGPTKLFAILRVVTVAESTTAPMLVGGDAYVGGRGGLVNVVLMMVVETAVLTRTAVMPMVTAMVISIIYISP